MLLGYVSDEMFTALHDVEIELEGAEGVSCAVRSRPSGAVHADIPAGVYEAVLAKDGYGRKRAQVHVDGRGAHQFRLLADSPYAYVWPKFVRGGETGELRAHSGTPYVASLWRYGWRREHIADLGVFADHPPGAIRQIIPDGDIARDGVAWNRHGYLFPAFDPRTELRAPDRSGLYYVHLRNDSGRFFSCPWVVAPAAPTAPIAVLAADMTWNAYNDFGGRSNYIAPSALPARPTVNAHQENLWFSDPLVSAWNVESYEPLSFDRPEPLNATLEHEEITEAIVTRGAEHVAPAEWRLLGWLEREGFDYDLYAESQLEAGIVDLDAYRVLVLSTHPEYWTRAMYDRVKAWVTERGGRLMYLGGNGINCEVELVEDGRMLVLNGDHFGRGAAHDSRFAMRGESSAALLGVATTMTGYETGAPYRVSAASHWAFAGTGLRDGDLFGMESLDRRAVGGASGHETDKRTPSTPPQAQLLAKGTNPDDGGAEIVHIEFPGRGQVFSVGSISYTCSIAVDDTVSQVTRNVLSRFLT